MKINLIILLIVWVSPFLGQAQISITEEFLLQRIESSNELVKAGEHRVEAAEKYTGLLGRSFLPKASIFAAQESFKYAMDDFQTQPYYGVKLEMNLYNGGRDRVSNSLTETRHSQKQSELKIIKYKQLEDARKTMWRALYLKELVAQYQEAQKLLHKNRREALRRIKGGVATRSDQYEFDIKSAELSQDIEKAKLGLDKEKGLLKIILGIESGETIELVETLEHDHNWRQLIAHDEAEHSYLLRPQEHEVERALLRSNLGARKWLPKLDAYAWWQQLNRRQDFDRLVASQRQLTNFGLQLKWDFADFISGNIKKNAERSFAKANSLQLNFKKRELENELHLELRELELLDGMAHVAEENIERSQKFFQLITKEYKRGVKTSGDMLAATEKLVASKVRKMMIVRDFNMAKAHIMTKLGK